MIFDPELLEALRDLARSNRELAEAMRDNAEATREATEAEHGGESGSTTMDD